MKGGLRQSMAWLHTWVGLILGWLVLAIFVTGTASYFKSEITQWMQPETHFVIPAPEQSARVAVTAMQRVAPNALVWGISLPSSRVPVIDAYWQEKSGTYQSGLFNPLTGEKIQARETQGGDFFYRFHYQLYGFPSPLGSILVGIAAMFMLVALISGVITHKKFFKDFFTFRPRKGQRSWLDFHNLVGVVALPFFLMITYTGLAIFFYLYMPFGIMEKYGPDAGKFYEEIQHGVKPTVVATPVPAQMPAINGLIAKASSVWQDGAPIGSMEIEKPNTDQAVINFTRQAGAMLNTRFGDEMAFDANSGLPAPKAHNSSGMAQTGGVIYGLHEARFASMGLRWVLFASGLLGCAMVATGLILWTVKRRNQNLKIGKTSVGHFLVERLNIAAIVGLPLAMGAYLMANRIVQANIVGRSDMEVSAFFWVWGLTLIYALLRPWQQAWRELMMLLALVYLALPVVSGVTLPESALPTTLRNGQWVLASVELTVFGFGLFFAMAAYRLWRPRKVVAARHTRKKHGGSR